MSKTEPLICTRCKKHVEHKKELVKVLAQEYALIYNEFWQRNKYSPNIRRVDLCEVCYKLYKEWVGIK